MIRNSGRFRRGRAGEKLVAGLLQQRGWLIVPTYDYSGENGDSAPRMKGEGRSLTLPDLDVSKAGIRRWVEVKVRWSASFTHKTQRYEFGIPLRHFRSYQQVEVESGATVWLFVVEESTGRVLYARLRDLAPHVRLYLGDKIAPGGMAFFPREVFWEFGTIEAGSLLTVPGE